MIPLALVTGFLGSGKTSFLKHAVARYRGRRVVFLVNEFSPLDIDGELVQREDADVVAVPGGSIFCKCLVTEFIGQLKRIAHDYPDAEGVIVEASGMANPAVVGGMLSETKLDSIYELATVVAVVDPGSFLKLQHTLPNVADQVRAAQVVLLNKIDCHDAATLAETERVLRRLNADAQLEATTMGRSDIDLFAPPAPAPDVEGEFALCRDPNYRSEVLDAKGDINLDQVAEALRALGDDCYRAKGYVPAGGRLHFFDLSSSGLSVTPTEREGTEGRMAVILRGAAPEATTAALRQLMT